MKVNRQLSDYADLLERPAPVSTRFVPMDRLSRAAQFASYKALNGFEDMVIESARPTETRFIEPDEDGFWDINQRLGFLNEHIAEHPTVMVSYFLKDVRKAGGSTQSVTGQAKRIDPLTHQLILLASNGISDGQAIPLSAITLL